MRTIRDVLHYYYDERCSKRQIAGYLHISPGTVRNYLRRAEAAGVFWPLLEEYTDETLEALLFPRTLNTSIKTWPILRLPMRSWIDSSNPRTVLNSWESPCENG